MPSRFDKRCEGCGLEIAENPQYQIPRERKPGMKNSIAAAGGLVLLLIGCSHIDYFSAGISTDETTGKSPPPLEEALADPGDIILPADDVEEPAVYIANPPFEHQGLETSREMGQELSGSIPDLPMNYGPLAITEPDLPPLGREPSGGEGRVEMAPGFPGGDEESLLAEFALDIAGESQAGEEEITGEPAFDIPIVINGKVEKFVTYYKTRGRKIFSRWLARSGKYIPLLKRLLREKELPEDLVYLALIESGYNPHAYSRRKAMGLWQFRYNTGKRYGLKVDWWIDERRDPVKSTIAAARYLKDLHDRFECWYLAAAGYNAGEGKILRAIKRYKTEDFWELTKYPYLKRETKNFIPKMIAAALMAKNPEEYGFTDIEYEEPIRFETVTVPDATDLRVIAEACESTYDELKRLNPELRRWCTPPNYLDYELKLPYGKKEIFLRNFAEIPPSKRITYRRHVVRSGETLSHIAIQYGTDMKTILRMNRITNRHRIRAGRSLIIPVRGSGSVREGRREKVLKGSGDPPDYDGRAFTYTVRKGDTLWDISRSVGIDLESLCRWNGIQNASRIYPGDRLKMRIGDHSTSSGAGGEG
jgi:membrane-bound lytic murein transglycosylase D